MAEAKAFGSRRSFMDSKENRSGDSPRETENDLDSKQSAKQSTHDVDDEDAAAEFDQALEGGASGPPRRASVGWSTETTDEQPTSKTTAETKRPGRRRKGSEAQGSGAGGGSDNKSRNRYFDEDGDSSTMVEIPDLEEEEREVDITMQVAEAPRNTNRAVQSLKELEKDIKFALPNLASLGVDVHLLTSALCPEKAIFEADDPWIFDNLLNEVAQEMQKDVDEKEEILKAEGG